MFQSRSPRYPVRFDAVIDDGDRSLSAPVTNLSETGLFLETTTGLKAGARVRIIPLTQEAGGLSEFEGEVVRTQNPVKTGGVKRAPGIAIRFVHLLPPDKARLLKFCRKALGGPTANDDKDDEERSTRRMPSQAKAKKGSTKVGKTTASSAVARKKKEFKNPAKATEVDALVDLTADAALVDEQAIEATAVTPKIKTSESEAEFFAKGESFADGAPLDAASVIETQDQSVIVHAQTGAGDARSFLRADPDSQQLAAPQSSKAADELEALEREIDAVDADTPTRDFASEDDAATQLLVTDDASAPLPNASSVAEKGGEVTNRFDDDEGETEAFVYSDQQPKPKLTFFSRFSGAPAEDNAHVASAPPGTGRYDNGIYFAAMGAALALVVVGLTGAHDALDARHSALETQVLMAQAEHTKTQRAVATTSATIASVSIGQRALSKALTGPRLSATAAVSPIGDGVNVLVEAQSRLDNQSAEPLVPNFSRTRIFLKEVRPRAAGQAPLAVDDPLAKGARGWIEIVDDAKRIEKPYYGEFELGRRLKKRLKKASEGLTMIPEGESTQAAGRWVLAAGKPAVIAVVQEWYVTPQIEGDPGAEKKGRTLSHTTMLGLPSAK